MINRNFNDPEYKRWRISVYKRDKFKCRFPHCCSKVKLNAHHIKTWSKHPELRFKVSNGITLCKNHHRQVTGKEQLYEEMFTQIVCPSSVNVKFLLYQMRKKNVR